MGSFMFSSCKINDSASALFAEKQNSPAVSRAVNIVFSLEEFVSAVYDIRRFAQTLNR